MNEYFKFSIDGGRRIIKETIFGIWTEEIAKSYSEAFKDAIQPLLGQPWAKLVDLNNWETSHPDVIQTLGLHLDWAVENGLQYSANILSASIPRLQLRLMFKAADTAEISEVFPSEDLALIWLQEKGF
ncbi:MAG: hypothetical protein JEZ06_11630 [Anaerolineaceae bacterium]|nr:hypothetical protein [Anaerolineaceae bacterium]